MSRLQRFVTVILALFLCSCSASGKRELSDLYVKLDGNYSVCAVFETSSGEKVFGGILKHENGVYEFEVNSPENISGIVYKVTKDGFSVRIGAYETDISEKSVQKLKVLTEVLSERGKAEGKSVMYGGKSATEFSFEHYDMVTRDGKPAKITAGGLTVKLSDFSVS